MAEYEAECISNFIRICAAGAAEHWHERNAGNLSYRLNDAEVQQLNLDAVRPGPWEDLASSVEPLAGERFLVTAAGAHMRNVSLQPSTAMGVVGIDERGRRWRVEAGLQDGRPTSEFMGHLLSHAAFVQAGDDRRAIYHAHSAYLTALTCLLPHEDAAFTCALWKSMTECITVFPRGVAAVPWMMPGSMELAQTTAKALAQRDAAVWAHHGTICGGASLDDAFGLMQMMESAAHVYLLVRQQAETDRPAHMVTNNQLEQIADHYNLDADLSLLQADPTR